eukprot:1158781-Pelagomonas_calceolata.AAC.8
MSLGRSRRYAGCGKPPARSALHSEEFRMPCGRQPATRAHNLEVQRMRKATCKKKLKAFVSTFLPFNARCRTQPTLFPQFAKTLSDSKCI